MKLDERFRDRKTQAGAADFIAQRVIGAVEAAEQVLLLLRQNAYAIVLDIDLQQTGRIDECPQRDMRAGIGVFYRI